ncbi:MAG TPA: rhodanese-related sulfurtransferase [Candidatus Nesterenkonia stercoripullorum]|uniref:tRNA uridine(34) hydroxylase n=1 Tax=Candidatus Nesterenkonia stercoripullorum TaxID=2838701 RepID=A0A9D1USF5_9MICC|nr:rhodanese-related sulfurtransferase [Candidatus Nesterenkonia stercoripullorum]
MGPQPPGAHHGTLETVSISRIVLYYTFTPLADPEAVRLWQHAICRELGLTGRILVSPQGINGTVGGELKAVKSYVKQTRAYAPFKDMAFKWSEGGAADFPRLSVKTRPELVAFGAGGEIEVDENGVVDGGTHLRPHQVHELVEQTEAGGGEVTFFDGRNTMEAAIGRFRNAVVPEVETTRDFVAELDSGAYDHLKDKPVVTYCTGGIRCEVLSALMVKRGFNQVYQIDGGIVRYGEAYGDDGLWEGELYVFDSRMATAFSPNAKTLGCCSVCGSPTSQYLNCCDPGCSTLQLYCTNCQHIPALERCTTCTTRRAASDKVAQ